MTPVRRSRLLPGVLLMLTAAAMFIVSGCASDRASHHAFQVSETDVPFDAAAGRTPTPRTLLTMANLLVAQGKDVEADYVLTRLIEEHPHIPAAYIAKAEIHMRARSVEQARQVLQRGLDATPDHPDLINNLGMCAMVEGNIDMAAGYFERAVEIQPTNERYTGNLAVAWGMLGKDEAALHLFMGYLRPEDAYHNLGVIYEMRGEDDAAATAFIQARKLRENALP